MTPVGLRGSVPEIDTGAAAATGYHTQPLLEPTGYIPLIKFEEEYYRNQTTQAVVAGVIERGLRESRGG